MTKNPEMFWRFLVNGRQNATQGVLGNFYAAGQHCGEALHRVLLAAADQEFLDAYALEASRLYDDDELPEEALTLADGTLMLPTHYVYPLDDEYEPEFVAPTGIIKSMDGEEDEEEYDYELIRECFVAYAPNEEGFFRFELVVEQARLADTFFRALHLVPAVNGLWLQLQDHWDDGPTELWRGPESVEAPGIEAFLRQHRPSTLENGFVDCIVSSARGETSLTLDEHKTIRLQTQDEQVFIGFLRGIEQLGFERNTDELYTLEVGFHHYHYRPHDSLGREELRTLLQRQGFELFDSWD
jgi:hypothetical protein